MNDPSMMLAKSDSGLTPPIPATQQRLPERAIDFNEWHKKKTEWINTDNRAEQFGRWRKWDEILNFFVGNQLIWWNGSIEDGYYKNAELEEGDPYFASNIFQPFINGLIAELYRSNPKLTVSAKTDQWRQVEAAVVAKHGLEQEIARLWSDENKLRNLFFYVNFGNSIWYTPWIAEGGPQVKIPQYEQQTHTMDSRFGVCPTCGMQQDLSGFDSPSGTLSKMAGLGNSTPPGSVSSPMSAMSPDLPEIAPPPMCPDCQEPLQIMGNKSEVQMPVYQGEKEQDGGDTQLFILDPTQCKMHLGSRNYKETPYLNINNWMLMDIAKMIYGENINFTNPTGKDTESQRSFLRRHEAMVGNVTGMGAWGAHNNNWSRSSFANDQDLTMIAQYWLRPSMYYHVILKNPIDTEKYQIPAGVALREVFPKGMVLTKNNDILLDLDDRQINKHFVHVRYQGIETKIWGDSVAEQLVQGQREYNEGRSIELENYAHNATPCTIVNPKKIKPTNISGKARDVVSMENTSKADDNPGNYIYTGEPRSLGGDIPMFKQGIKGDMQLISASPVGESGIPGSSSDTATGMQIIRDWTNSKLAIRIGPLTSALKAQSGQILELIQKYWVGNRYIKISNEVGLDDGKWFQGADIRGDFDIGVRPGSDRTLSSMELKDNVLQFLVAGGVPFGGLNPAFPRQAAVILSRELGLPMDLDNFTMHARKQRDEIEDIKIALEMTAQNMQAQVGQIQQAAMQDPSVDPMMMQQMAQQAAMQGVMQAVPVEETDNHQAHIDTIKYYLNTDTGRRESPQIKAAIIEHMHIHEQAMMMDQMNQAMMATANGMMQMQPGGMVAGSPGGGNTAQGQGKPPSNNQDKQPRPQKEGQ